MFLLPLWRFPPLGPTRLKGQSGKPQTANACLALACLAVGVEWWMAAMDPGWIGWTQVLSSQGLTPPGQETGDEGKRRGVG